MRGSFSSLCAACAIALVQAAVPVGLEAQSNNFAPLVLQLPGGTRALGMGDAYVAMSGDNDVIFYNPAQLTNARGIGISVQRYGSTATLTTLSSAAAFAPGGLGVGVQMLEHAVPAGEFPAAGLGGVGALRTRGPVLASSTVMSVGFGRVVRWGVRAGVVAKVIEQRLADTRDGVAAFDVGFARGSTVPVGFSVQNIGPDLRIAGSRAQLPLRARVGVAVPRRMAGPVDLAGSTSLSVLRDGTVTGAGGVEVGYLPLDGFTFVFRAGVRDAGSDGSAHGTVGTGFIGDRFTVEYAYQSFEGPGGAHRVGVRWR